MTVDFGSIFFNAIKIDRDRLYLRKFTILDIINFSEKHHHLDCEAVVFSDLTLVGQFV